MLAGFRMDPLKFYEMPSHHMASQVHINIWHTVLFDARSDYSLHMQGTLRVTVRHSVTLSESVGVRGFCCMVARGFSADAGLHVDANVYLPDNPYVRAFIMVCVSTNFPVFCVTFNFNSLYPRTFIQASHNQAIVPPLYMVSLSDTLFCVRYSTSSGNGRSTLPDSLPSETL